MSTEARALHHLQKSIEINPHFVDARVFLAEYYHRNKKPDKALEIINESLSKGLKNSKLLNLKALIQFEEFPCKKGVEETLKDALKFAPKNVETLNLALKISSMCGNSKLKLFSIEQLISTNSASPQLYLEIAVIKFKHGLIEDAKRYFELVVDLMNDDVNCLVRAADFFFLCRNDFEEQDAAETIQYIRTLLSKVLSLESTNSHAKLLLSFLELKQGNEMNALKLMKDCFEAGFDYEKYFFEFHQLILKIEGRKKADDILKVGLSKPKTKGMAFYLLAKQMFDSKNKECVRYSLNAIFHLARVLRLKIKRYSELKNNSEFYAAKFKLTEIESLSGMISESYLVYYKFCLHKNKLVKTKALKGYKFFKSINP